MLNHQIRLAKRPAGLVEATDFERTEEAVPEPGEGQLVAQVLYLSVDPAMRGWMDEGRSYVPPVGIGEVMRAVAVGRVIASRHPGFAEGDHVVGPFGVQEYALSNGKGVTKVDPAVAPLPVYLGALGATGMTAYFGLLDVGRPEPGQTVVVSGAAGGVGSIVGQIGKIKGCRVIGIAGGPDKCRWIVEELGFDAAIDYHTQDVKKALREYAPNGVDVYFDNVGGDILDAVLTRLARRARVVVCGAISQYNNEGPVHGPTNYLSLLVNRARMEGFIVFDYADRYPEAAKQIAAWMKAGKLRRREQVIDGGVDAFTATLLKLFRGENTGKLVLRVA